MIAYLLKNWKLLLDLILVVGGIIALTLFDPFGFFTSSKLKGTANLVSSIRDIGELTTAEYYGEVVSSLHETKIHNVPVDSLYNVFEDCYIELRRSVATALVAERRIKTNDWSKVDSSPDIKGIRTLYDASNSNKTYSSLLTFIAVHNLPGETKDYYDLNDLVIKNNTEKKVLQWLTDRFVAFKKGLKKDIEDISSTDLDQFILDLPTNFTGITNFHFELKKKGLLGKRKRRKQDIVFIGRGWVKAGFRFDQLDESNFFYDKEAKVIQFYGLTPTVLDKDINPWFIPEEKIKGFELVNYYKGASFEEAAEVKKKCKEKLLEQAHHADLLNAAKINGQQTLKDFFGLLLDEPDLKVELLDYPFAKEYEMVAADTLITVNEALMVKRLYQEQLETQSNQNAFNIFLNRLKSLAFLDQGFQFSLLSLDAADILDHALFVTPNDYEKIKSLRTSLIPNAEGMPETSYMQKLGIYDDYNVFLSDFNEMLSAIDYYLKKSEDLRKDTLYLSTNSSEAQNLPLDSEYFHKQKVVGQDHLIKVFHKQEKAPVFSNLRYPTLPIIPGLFDDISLLNVDDVDSLLVTARKGVVFNTDDREVMQLGSKELDLLLEFKQDSIKRDIQLKPIRSLTRSVKKLVQ